MPELPEVETICRGLGQELEGLEISSVEVRRPDLRFPLPESFAERLTGRRIRHLSRRAKYLIWHLSSDLVLVSHLGMSGSFRIRVGADIQASPKDPAHDHLVFQFRGGRSLVYNDPRRFGFMDLLPAASWADHVWFSGLGPEPTGNELSAEYLAPLLTRRRSPIKAVLLDQRTIAGLGNIYVSEALWRARISPRRTAATLVGSDGHPGVRVTRLVDAVRKVIADAIAAGGSSIGDYTLADGSLGRFQHQFSVYDRAGAPCPRSPQCHGTVRRIVQSGRSTYYCPVCQR